MAAQLLATHGPKYGTLSPSAEEARVFLLKYEGETTITAEMAGQITNLWKDPVIQIAFKNRHQFQLFDSSKYFFDKVSELIKPDYKPSDHDILLIRARTTGIVKVDCALKNEKFVMCDVGGQRSERRKWIGCFDDVTGIVFVAALSDYDLTCFEDEKTNRLMESLSLFEEICNKPLFKNTTIILFLNKSDLFADKIQYVPLTACFPEYRGPNTFDAGTKYIEQQFLAKSKSPGQNIRTFVTCETDQASVQQAFEQAFQLIIKAPVS